MIEDNDNNKKKEEGEEEIHILQSAKPGSEDEKMHRETSRARILETIDKPECSYVLVAATPTGKPHEFASVVVSFVSATASGPSGSAIMIRDGFKSWMKKYSRSCDKAKREGREDDNGR